MIASTDAQFPPVEPILDADDIQGNAVPGFMKPRMALSALAIENVVQAKGWIGRIAPRMTTLAQAMETRVKIREHRTLRPATLEQRLSVPPEVDDAWVNIGFSFAGLHALLGQDDRRAAQLAEFQDEAFSLGLAARSSLLGDPTDPHAEGNPANWVVGKPGAEPHVLLVYGADRPDRLTALMEEIRGGATASGMSLLYERREAGRHRL